MGIEVFFNSDGTGVTAVITVINVSGDHVDPDSWPITNDPAIVLSSHPSAAKTITKVDTGVYTAEWSSLSPALSNGDIVNIAIDGAISSVAWTTWRNFLQVMRLPASQSSVDTVDTVVDAIKVKTDQLVFTVANQVDANTLTGGADAATIYTYFTSGSNEDVFKADVSALATSASIAALNDLSSADVTAAVPTVGQTADAVWDELLTGASHNIATSAGRRLRELAEVGLYEGASVWIDTVNGAAGSADYENGTVINPSDNIADATTIANSVGLSRFRIAPASSLTLASGYTGFTFLGDGQWTLALGGQALSDTMVVNADVSGTCTSTNEPMFDCCGIGTVTLPTCFVRNSRLSSAITLSDAGAYHFEGCMSAVAGTGSPSIDFGSAVGSTNVNFRHYSGGIEVLNMGQTGTDNMSLEGDGALTINANCTGGTIALRGNFKVTDNSGGAITIVKDDDTTNIVAVKTDTGDLVTRITSTLFSGITSMAEWLGIMSGKQTGNSTARTEIRATGAGSGTFDETTDSLEAIKDAGGGGDASSSNQTTIINHLTDIKGSGFDTGTDTLEDIRNALGGSGAGAFQITLTIKKSNGDTVGEADCILTTSDTSSSTNIYASVKATVNGIATFNVDAGTYYLWRQKAGVNFPTTPVTLTVDGSGNVTES